MEIGPFLTALQTVATSAYALLGYAFIVGAWIYYVYEKSKLQSIRALATAQGASEASLKLLIKSVYNTTPREGLSAEQWLRDCKNRLFFIAFVVTVVALSIIIVIAVLNANNLVVVQLLKTGGGEPNGEFTLIYKQPRRQANGSTSGTAGKAYITDLPRVTKSLEIIQLKQIGFKIKDPPKNDVWTYPIDDSGHVTITVVDKYAPLEPPTCEDILEKVAQARLTKHDILKTTLATIDEKKAVILDVINNAGDEFKLLLYDISWCFVPGSAVETPFADVRFEPFNPEKLKKVFKRLYEFKTTSGYFALYIDYKVAGEHKRLFVGIRNLFDTSNAKITVGKDETKHFTIGFEPR